MAMKMDPYGWCNGGLDFGFLEINDSAILLPCWQATDGHWFGAGGFDLPVPNHVGDCVSDPDPTWVAGDLLSGTSGPGRETVHTDQVPHDDQHARRG